MLELDKITRILSIPYSGFVCVIFGIMILSFPIGCYVMFNSDIGNEVNFQFPLDGFNMFLGDLSYKLPVSFEIGDGFIISWAIYAILFTISFLGPQGTFMRTLSEAMSEGWKNLKDNDLVNMMIWFTILILFSVTVDFAQQSVGVNIEQPQTQNNLIHFFQLTVAPLTEESGFRVLLIGIPLFMIYSHSASWKLFLKSLWRPSHSLGITNYKKAIALIITVGLFFGAAHIISGTPWSPGKFSQATIAGIIIGWVYVRYGFAPAVLIHWATNYFIFSYMFFIADLSQTPISHEFSNQFSNTLEGILVVTGVISLMIKILNYIKSKKESAAIRQT
ncbi:MAG: CPBP family intramembrane metalloprotease [Thaumarchaeota archaeon]|nr:MAG: CPBP family intramembrane metalloprotease [Nitrososphaerota archaeon]